MLIALFFKNNSFWHVKGAYAQVVQMFFKFSPISFLLNSWKLSFSWKGLLTELKYIEKWRLFKLLLVSFIHQHLIGEVQLIWMIAKSCSQCGRTGRITFQFPHFLLARHLPFEIHTVSVGGREESHSNFLISFSSENRKNYFEVLNARWPKKLDLKWNIST